MKKHKLHVLPGGKKSKTEKLIKVGKVLWNVAKSDEAMAAVRVITVSIALIHAVDEYKKSKRRAGFQM